MAIRHFTELICWQLADQLETDVIQLIKSSPADRHFAFRDELLTALSSVPSNLAEGFTRKSPREECRFFDIALASLSEVQARLGTGIKLKYFTAAEVAPLLQLGRRIFATAIGYKRHQQRYIRENPPPVRPRPPRRTK